MDNNPIVNSIIIQTRATGVDDAIQEVARLEKQVLSFQRHIRGIHNQRLFSGKEDIKALKGFDYQFAKAFRPGVKSAAAFATNLTNVTKALRSNSVAGIATAKSIANLERNTKQYDTTALRMLNRQQKMRVMMAAVGTGLGDLSRKYQSLGRNMQWVGRTMMMGLTVPMVAGTTIAIKQWNRLNEQITRVQKVTTSKQFRELGGAEGLIKTARELGNEFGIVSEMVAAVQGDFAAMGYAGKKELDGITKLSLEISRLGEVDLSDSTKAVRSIVEIFGEAGNEVESAGKILYAFNAIENNTAIGLKDLIPTFPEVANAAKNFGLTAEETAAAMAGMYEQGIPAAEVATSLKYVLASLVKPTQQTKDMISALAKKEPEIAATFMGLEKGTIAGRAGLEQLAGAYENLVSRVGTAEATELLVNIVGKRQLNRVLALFNSIAIAKKEALAVTNTEDLAAIQGIDPEKFKSDYARALAVSGQSEQARLENAKRAQKELNNIYQSDAFKREQAMANFKSAVAEIGKALSGPVSSAINTLGNVIKSIVEFLNNNPWAKTFIMGAAAIMAAIGPLVFILGQSIQVFGTLGIVTAKLLPSFGYLSRAMVGDAAAAELLSGKFVQLGDYFANFDGPIGRFIKNMRSLRSSTKGPMDAAVNSVDDLVAAELKMQPSSAIVAKASKVKAAATAQASNVINTARATEAAGTTAVDEVVEELNDCLTNNVTAETAAGTAANARAARLYEEARAATAAATATAAHNEALQDSTDLFSDWGDIGPMPEMMGDVVIPSRMPDIEIPEIPVAQTITSASSALSDDVKMTIDAMSDSLMSLTDDLDIEGFDLTEIKKLASEDFANLLLDASEESAESVAEAIRYATSVGFDPDVMASAMRDSRMQLLRVAQDLGPGSLSPGDFVAGEARNLPAPNTPAVASLGRNMETLFGDFPEEMQRATLQSAAVLSEGIKGIEGSVDDFARAFDVGGMIDVAANYLDDVNAAARREIDLAMGDLTASLRGQGFDPSEITQRVRLRERELLAQLDNQMAALAGAGVPTAAVASVDDILGEVDRRLVSQLTMQAGSVDDWIEATSRMNPATARVVLATSKFDDELFKSERKWRGVYNQLRYLAQGGDRLEELVAASAAALRGPGVEAAQQLDLLASIPQKSGKFLGIDAAIEGLTSQIDEVNSILADPGFFADPEATGDEFIKQMRRRSALQRQLDDLINVKEIERTKVFQANLDDALREQKRDIADRLAQEELVARQDAARRARERSEAARARALRQPRTPGGAFRAPTTAKTLTADLAKVTDDVARMSSEYAKLSVESVIADSSREIKKLSDDIPKKLLQKQYYATMTPELRSLLNVPADVDQLMQQQADAMIARRAFLLDQVKRAKASPAIFTKELEELYDSVLHPIHAARIAAKEAGEEAVRAAQAAGQLFPTDVAPGFVPPSVSARRVRPGTNIVEQVSYTLDDMFEAVVGSDARREVAKAQRELGKFITESMSLVAEEFTPSDKTLRDLKRIKDRSSTELLDAKARGARSAASEAAAASAVAIDDLLLQSSKEINDILNSLGGVLSESSDIIDGSEDDIARAAGELMDGVIDAIRNPTRALDAQRGVVAARSLGTVTADLATSSTEVAAEKSRTVRQGFSDMAASYAAFLTSQKGVSKKAVEKAQKEAADWAKTVPTEAKMKSAVSKAKVVEKMSPEGAQRMARMRKMGPKMGDDAVTALLASDVFKRRRADQEFLKRAKGMGDGKRGLLHRLFGLGDKQVAKGGFLAKIFTPMQNGIKKIAAMIPAGGLIGSLLGGAGTGATTVTAAIGAALSGPVAIIAAVVAAVVGLIFLLAKLSGHWKAFWNGFKAAAKPALGFLKGAWEGIKDTLSILWDAVKAIFTPFKEVLNEVMGMLSGEDGSANKKAASGWAKIGAVIGAIGTVLSFIIKLLVEIIKIIAKIIAWFAKLIAPVIKFGIKLGLLVSGFYALIKVAGLFAKHWRSIVNFVIDAINEIIKALNGLPFVDIKLIPRIADMQKFEDDFNKLRDMSNTSTTREALIKLKVQEELANVPKEFLDRMTKKQKQEFINTITFQIETKVDEANAKIAKQEERLIGLRNQRAAQEAKVNSLIEKRNAQQEEINRLEAKANDPDVMARGGLTVEETTALANLRNERTILNEKIREQNDLIGGTTKKIQDLKTALADLRTYSPDQMEIFNEANLGTVAQQQKQIDDYKTKLEELEKQLSKAQYTYEKRPIRAQIKMMKEEMNKVNLERQRLLREMYNNIPKDMKKDISFQDFVAYVNVEFKYDEFTQPGDTIDDRLNRIMANMPTVFAKTFTEAEEAAIDAAQKYSDTLKSKLDDTVSKLKDMALRSFEEGAKQRLAVFDAQIKAIEDLEKAEQELFETQQYYENRRKMMDQFALTTDNYRKERALAIYEGRYDDARMLDRQYQADSQSHQDELKNIDDERNKALLQKERDAQKERLNAQKQALQEQLDAQKEHFQNMLDVITEYTPKNVGELQNMINAMNAYLGNEGFPQISGTFASGTALWSEATNAAGKDLMEAAYWAGQGAATAAVAGMMGESPEFVEWINKLKPEDQKAVRAAIAKFLNPKPEATTPSNVWSIPSWVPHVAVPEKHTGGMMGTIGSSPTDMPAMLQSGEFVMRRKAVEKLGVGFLSNLNQYHEGGLVGRGMRQMMFSGLGTVYANMLNAGSGLAGLNMMRLKQLLSPQDLAGLMGKGATGGAEAQPIRGAVDPANLMITPFQDFLAFLFPNAAYPWIKYGSTYRPESAGSFHGSGQALDIGGAVTAADEIQKIFEFLVPRVEKFDIVELIFKNIQYDKGPGWRPYGGDDHYSHIHVAVGTRLNELIASNPNFFTPLMRGGKIPVDNLPALLHKGEVVLPANIVRNIENANAGAAGGDTYIMVDTFVGQRQWFESMMKEYNIKTLPAEQRRRGTMNRVVSSRKDNTVRFV